MQTRVSALETTNKMPSKKPLKNLSNRMLKTSEKKIAKPERSRASSDSTASNKSKSIYCDVTLVIEELPQLEAKKKSEHGLKTLAKQPTDKNAKRVQTKLIKLEEAVHSLKKVLVKTEDSSEEDIDDSFDGICQGNLLDSSDASFDNDGALDDSLGDTEFDTADENLDATSTDSLDDILEDSSEDSMDDTSEDFSNDSMDDDTSEDSEVSCTCSSCQGLSTESDPFDSDTDSTQCSCSNCCLPSSSSDDSINNCPCKNCRP